MRKAFVIVDYQNDFINGSLGFKKASLIKKNILELLRNLDFKDTHLLITLDTHSKDYLPTPSMLSAVRYRKHFTFFSLQILLLKALMMKFIFVGLFRIFVYFIISF